MDSNRKQKILVIVGPTAVGKSDMALRLAREFNGELVAADSRQVYKGLDIGTGKEVSSEYEVIKEEGKWIVNGIPVWMYDVVNPKEQYNLKEYIDGAIRVIEGILSRGKLPIIVGGTGLYVRSLLEGIAIEDQEIDWEKREKLENKTVEELVGELTSLSPLARNQLNESDRKNKRRLIRQIEKHMYPYMDTDLKTTPPLARHFPILKIGLSAPRPVLNSRIDLRLISRIDQGLIAEAENLFQNGLTLEKMRSLGLEYGVLADFFEGNIKREEILKKLQEKNHQYAKRQETWFKKDKEIRWFDITQKNFETEMAKLVENWYNAPNDPQS